MLESVRIARRQSEIRQSLAELAGKESPTEDELRSMSDLDRQYQANETRLRASLIAEDTERRDAGAELETRGGREWSELCQRFELRQAALMLDEGKALDGATREIVDELRGRGGYRGIPIPLEALELRAGETIASGTPNPIRTLPIVDRLFAQSVAMRMGTQMINADFGELEVPVTSGGAVVGWAATELGAVGAPNAFATLDRPLKPNSTMGARMVVSRRALKQSGSALEQAIRRDLSAAITQELDRVIFQGTGADGQPLGVIAGAATYSINVEEIDDVPRWGVFRAAVTRFMGRNAVSAPSEIRVLARPEVWDDLDSLLAADGATTWEWDRLLKAIGSGNVTLSANALAAPGGDPLATKALLTTTANGVAPIFAAIWGGVDLIRDPFTDAASGALRLTGLVTADVTISRAAQLEVLDGIERLPAT